MDSLKRQLFITHSKPTLISTIGLSTAIVIVAVLYYFSVSLTETVLPNAIRANNLKISVIKTESLLNSWVVSKDSSDNIERRKVWESNITPSIAALLESYQSKNNNYDASTIELAEALNTKLFHLRDTQWWIEDITHYNDNNLAKTLLDQKVSIIFDNLDRLLNALRHNSTTTKQSSSKEKILLAQNYLLKSFNLLTKAVISGEEDPREKFYYLLYMADQHLQDINPKSNSSDDERRMLFWIDQEYNHYRLKSNEAIDLRHSKHWNGSLQQLKLKKVALEQEIESLLDTLTSNENAKLEKSTSNLSHYLWMFLLGSIIFIIFLQVCAIIIARMAANYYTSRLNNLTLAASALADDNTHQLAPIGNDEIGRLMTVFNKMKTAIHSREIKLTEQRNDINQLTRIVTHDMKPPMINIKGHAEIIAETGDALIAETTIDENLRHKFFTVKKSLKYIHTSVIRIDELIAGVLNYSKLSDRNLSRELINVRETTTQILELNQYRLRAAKIDLFNQHPIIYSDAAVLKFALSTLIDNAIAYKHPRKALHLDIRYEIEADMHIIHIQDNGIGITAHQAKNLFQISSQASSDGSFGVGLASARMLARKAQGDLKYQDLKGDDGSIFSLSLPKHQEPSV